MSLRTLVDAVKALKRLDRANVYNCACCGHSSTQHFQFGVGGSLAVGIVSGDIAARANILGREPCTQIRGGLRCNCPTWLPRWRVLLGYRSAP